jgi:cytochrome c
MRSPLRWACVGVLLTMSLATAGAVEDAVEGVADGQALVEVNCAGCHAIGLEGVSPLLEAPPFRELHQRYDVEFLSEALVEGIMTGHEAMPEFVFTPDEAAAVVAYLKSLEPDRN